MSTLLLDKLLSPSSIAIIGASDRQGSPGNKLTENLLNGGYKGKVFPVNPRYKSVLGVACYKSVKALDQIPDLAVILTPAAILKRTLVQCARKGIKVAVVMSGTEQPDALHHYARRLGIRLMGPYCAGLIRPHIGLNATYSGNLIHKGNLGLISESAALGAAMVDWAETNNVGFSTILSTGQDSDISLADLLDLLAGDWQTKAIIVYVDRVRSSRSLLSALSATARIKPVILMHSTHDGLRYCDALTRTGQVHSSDDVFETALNRTGVVRIRNFSNLYAAAKILSSGIRLKGQRLAIVGNANAPLMMAMERLCSRGFETPPLDNALFATLHKQHGIKTVGNNPILLRNPLKLSEHYTQVITALQESPDIDAILLVFVPDARNDPTHIATTIINNVSGRASRNKPLLTCFMGDASVREARGKLSESGLPTFRTPEAAADGMSFLYRHFLNQQQLMQLPNPTSRFTLADTERARALVLEELQAGHRVPGPDRVRELMQLFDIPVQPSGLATSAEHAVQIAERLGYPVAMKLISPNLSYKASVISTQLNICSAEEVSTTWQLIKDRLHHARPDATFDGILIETMRHSDNPRHLALSISRDPVFGPVISVGIGGDLTALMAERMVQLPPLNRFLINDMLRSNDLSIYLGAFRHTQALDDEAVGELLRRLSELACEIPEVFALDINPLIVDENGVVALDVQLVLEQANHQQRYQHLAIHPYPRHWIRDMTLKDGTSAQLRPIRPEDAASLQTMFRAMSAESRYFRFMHTINELSPQMMVHFTKLDYDRQMAFVATEDGLDDPRPDGALQNIIGTCRYMMSHDRQSGEFAIAVSDQSAGKGLATRLMRLLIEHARSQKLKRLEGDVLRNNKPMQALMRSLGFVGKISRDDAELMIYTYDLTNDHTEEVNAA